ncbi:hypothetical protein BDV18DRAFT_163216 [Aspergillus unguis]
MPRKRASEEPHAAGSKKPNTGTGTSTSTAQAQTQATSALNKRWSAVSVSRNLAQAYLERRDLESYICICQSQINARGPDDSDDEDEDEDEEVSKIPKCDAGKTCVCNKPASGHPEHPYTLVTAAYQKFSDQIIHTNVRLPDAFDMYVFNDFAGYGVLEVLQNLAVDFEEARAQGDWKEMLDMGTVCTTFNLFGQMFLTMLATFESKGMLKPDSEVKNLGFIMAMYIWLADELRKSSCLERHTFEGPDFSRFDYYVFLYAKKYNIKLQGPLNVAELVEDLEEDSEEEEGENRIVLSSPSADPYDWQADYKEYAEDYGRITFIAQKRKMDGDGFDITSWTSSQRKQHAFDEKDPLGKEELAMIKQGGVMQME